MLHTEQEKNKFIQENYFQSEFLYYNSVKYGKLHQHLIMPSQNIYLKDRRETFLNSKYLQQQQFYKKEMDDSTETLFRNQDYNNFMTVDWLVWYDSYLKKTRDASFTYGYTILTPKHWSSDTFKGNKYPIDLNSGTENRRIQANQFTVSQVHTPFTHHSNIHNYNSKYIHK